MVKFYLPLQSILRYTPLRGVGCARQYSTDIFARYNARGDFKHNLMLIQPLARTFDLRFDSSKPELRLAEAISLVRTLEWYVAEATYAYTRAQTTSQLTNFFTSGILDRLVKQSRANESITAIFLATDIMTGYQQNCLEELFGLPVYDRYNLILQIFRKHANSGGARIQIALAEIPYLRSRLKEFHEKEGDKKYVSFSFSKGGSGETYAQRASRLLKERVASLQAELKSMSKNREILKKGRRLAEIPVVAVVGYTNSGKTSFIKLFSDSALLKPKDRLFATLEVCTFQASLPHFAKMAFLDTVGFISHLPVHLVQAFNVTLSDISSSDLIVHIYDASHPDLPNHLVTVDRTLRQLKVPENLLSTMIHVANKMDRRGETPIESLIPPAPYPGPRLSEEEEKLYYKQHPIDESHFQISIKNKTGIRPLVEAIDEQLQLNTGRTIVNIRVRSGGEAYKWLVENCTILEYSVDESDVNYLTVNVVMTIAMQEKFKCYFGAHLFTSSPSKTLNADETHLT